MHRDRRPLFALDDDPQAALEGWASRHAEALGHGAVAEGEAFTELELERVIEVPTPSGRTLVVHRYTQRYRGYRISGPGTTISVTSVDGEAISVIGAFVDGRRELAGLEGAASIDHIAQRLDELAPEVEVGDIELIAVPERGMIAWEAQLVDPGTGKRERALLATDGELLQRRALEAHSAFDHQPVNVLAHELSGDPQTTATTLHTALPGSTWNGSFNLSTGWFLRMGDDRTQVYDLQFSNDDITAYLTPQWYPGMVVPHSTFAAAPGGQQFTTQDHFHKLDLGVTEIDARMASFGWDHAPGSGFGVFTPEPVTLLANADGVPEAGESDLCGGSKAVFMHTGFGDAANQTAYTGIEQAVIVDCTEDAASVLHELGHYIDQYANFDVMGSTINSNTCVADTTDEAPALRETIGEIVKLYMHRALYPVDYTLSGTSTPCNFDGVNEAGKIHDASCISGKYNFRMFDDDRPSLVIAGHGCNDFAGYSVNALTQVLWSWMFRKSCSMTYPYGCSLSNTGHHRELLHGMIYAMNLSNAQSYETFFENVEVYLWAALGAAVSDNFHAAMASRGVVDP